MNCTADPSISGNLLVLFERILALVIGGICLAFAPEAARLRNGGR